MDYLSLIPLVKSYVDDMVLIMALDKVNPSMISYVKEKSKTLAYNDHTLIDKYVSLEAIIGFYKRVLDYFNGVKLDTYRNFSSISPNELMGVSRKLTIINSRFNGMYKQVSEMYDKDIITLRADFKKEDIKEYARSINVIADISKDLDESTLEDVKDALIYKYDYKRPNYLNTLYNRLAFPVDYSRFFSVREFELTPAYFEKLSEFYKVNVIVINLTKGNKYMIRALKEVDKILITASIKKNTTIRKLDDGIVLDLDEVTYYPKVKAYPKYLILKVLGSVNYIMSTFEPKKPEDAFIKLRENNRVVNYNAIIEEMFSNSDIIAKKVKPLYVEFISLENIKYRIKQAIGIQPTNKWIDIIMKEVKREVHEHFGIKLYEYISEYENLYQKMELELEMMKPKDTLDTFLSQVFPKRLNIFEEIRDSLMETL